MPIDYAGASLSVDIGTFWRERSVLGFDLTSPARPEPVRLRARPDTRVLDVGDEWVISDPAMGVPACWVIHPVLHGGAPRLQASRARHRAHELAAVRRLAPADSRAEALGVSLFNFENAQGWERDAALRSLRHLFERRDG